MSTILPRPRLTEILDRHRPALETLSPDQLVRPRVTRERAHELTSILTKSFHKVEPLLDAELSPTRAAERRAQAAALEEKALTFYAADLLAEETTADMEERRTSTHAVAEHDRLLTKWAVPLFGDDPELAETVHDIQRGRGHRDDAEDVVRLVHLFRKRWAQVQGMTPITEDILRQAEADATAQLELLTRQGDDVRDLARRAFTFWYLDYEALQALGRYLARDRDDVNARFPGVRQPHTRTRSTDDDDTETSTPEPGSDTPQPETGAA